MSGTQSLRLERSYDASPEDLWAAWTDPEQYAKWFNPFPGTDAEILEWDARPGGRIRFNMVTPDGQKYPNAGNFVSLDPPRELVTEEDGMRMRVTFEKDGDRTRMVIEQTGLPAEVDLDQARGGWSAILDKLESHVAASGADPADAAIVIARDFDAPREAVWEAWTDPERFKLWYGPEDHTIPSCTMDVRVGGKYLYCMRGPHGGDFWATGTYRVIERPRRLSMTEVTADEEGNVVPMSHYGMDWDQPMEMLLDLAFEDATNGGTRMTLRVTGLPPGDMAEGATAGWNAALDKLAAVLAERKEAAP